LHHLLYHLSHSRGWQARAVAAGRQGIQFCQDLWSDLPLVTRIGSHAGLLALVVLTVAMRQIPFDSTLDLWATRPGGPTDDTESDSISLFQAPSPFPDLSFFSISPLTEAYRPARTDVTTYRVQPGDTVTGIAAQFGITPNSVLWANPKLEDNPDLLSLDQTLTIPPVSGVLYTVQNSDSLSNVVSKFKGSESADAVTQALVKLDFNQSRHDLQTGNHTLNVGQLLMVPGGVKPDTAGGGTPSGRTSRTTIVPRGMARFGWPVVGRITQTYWSHHHAVDIAAPLGAPIHAANAGSVQVAGWDKTGYGNMVLINNGNGYQTRYGHLSAIEVKEGDVVQKGQVIGRVGNTGHSTGTHLHFEIIRNGVKQNPFQLLP
jgi:murein DD-endopeptidase MepM/ murein hydrolase activator NlpD